MSRMRDRFGGVYGRLLQSAFMRNGRFGRVQGSVNLFRGNRRWGYRYAQ